MSTLVHITQYIANCKIAHNKDATTLKYTANKLIYR